jgi:hypothetical protein
MSTTTVSNINAATSTTANKQFKYDQIFNGLKLSSLVDSCHKALSEKSNWKYNPLQPGLFGYDNMAMSIGHALSNKTDKTTLNELANLIHEGWVINYLYWRDNKPYDSNSFYKKPFNALGDDRRNKCAETKFADLDKEEQDKDIVIAQHLSDVLGFDY